MELVETTIPELFKFDLDKLELTVNGVTIALVGTYDEPWFPGKELCMVMGYLHPNKALFDHVKTVHKTTLAELKPTITDSVTAFFWPFSDQISFNEGRAAYMSEHGVYQLAMKCQLPIGDKFRDWLTEEVVPTIRRTGQYILHKQITDQSEQIAKQSQQIAKQSQQIVNQSQHIANQGKQLAILGGQLLELQEKVAVIPRNNATKHVFQLYKHREKSKEYLFIRRQRRSLSKAMRAGKIKEYDILFNEVDVPNSINILNKLKEKLMELGISFRSRYNTLTVIDDVYIVDIVHDLIKGSRPHRFSTFLVHKTESKTK
jgi:prophage antirepressor-like protein